MQTACGRSGTISSRRQVTDGKDAFVDDWKTHMLSETLLMRAGQQNGFSCDVRDSHSRQGSLVLKIPEEVTHALLTSRSTGQSRRSKALLKKLLLETSIESDCDL